MDLPFEKRPEKFWQQRSYAPVTREESQELRLPESMPDVGRVIAAWGQTVLRGKEWRSDHIGLTGGVMVWVLYAPEDGSGPRRLESWVPFHIRMDQAHDGEDGVIRAECVLCGVDARSLSSRKLMLRCQIGMMVQTLVPRVAELYSPGALPEDIQVLDRVYPMVLTRETGEKTFLCDEQLSLPQGTDAISRILYSRLTPRVTGQKVLSSRAVFGASASCICWHRMRGSGCAAWIYRCPLHSIWTWRGSTRRVRRSQTFCASLLWRRKWPRAVYGFAAAWSANTSSMPIRWCGASPMPTATTGSFHWSSRRCCCPPGWTDR